MDASPITQRTGEGTPLTRRERRRAEELAVTQRSRDARVPLSPARDETETRVLPAVPAAPDADEAPGVDGTPDLVGTPDVTENSVAVGTPNATETPDLVGTPDAADEATVAAVPEPVATGGRAARRRAAASSTSTATGPGEVVEVDVVVIGAGQAGLAAAYHLRRRGLVAVGERGWERASGSFVVLDDAPQPGGAWQHRWPTLTMADAHGIHDLPGLPLVVPDPTEPAAMGVPYYFAQYEGEFDLHVQRPVRVSRVEPGPDGRLLVRSHGVDRPDEPVVWSARGLINASGTWGKPFWPSYPGRGTFRGRQLHTRDYRGADELADGHVVVVGGGTSAVQLLLELARVTTTTWVTRRPPAWRDEEFTPEVGRDAVALVEERTRAGLPPQSIVSVTGLPLTDAYRRGIADGVLVARPVFDRIEPDGVTWTGVAPALDGWVDGPSHVEARTILWCTGFRPSLDHLGPLRLRSGGGGIVMDGTEVVADPRVQLVGYGPSASTVGATRAGREAVRNLHRLLGL